MSQPRSREIARRRFILVCVITTLAAALYTSLSLREVDVPPAKAARRVADDAAAVKAIRQRPYVIFRNDERGNEPGRIALAALDETTGARFLTDLRCERVHFAAGRGVCLSAERRVYQGHIFDDGFHDIRTFPLPGLPSRVRVAPDGRRAGITVFVGGDSYTSGGFSTRTFVVDMDTGMSLGELEQYAITRNGRPFKATDFNFWGITFADDDHIFATLASAARTYLIEARVGAKQGAVIYEGLECPALSPDRTRIAFKRRDTSMGKVVFQLRVLDLATLRDHALAEQRSVDDQPEWIDDANVAYGLPGDKPGETNVWAVAADGSGAPRELIEAAWSPAIIRP